MNVQLCTTPFDFDNVAVKLRLVEAFSDNSRFHQARKWLKDWATKHRDEGVAADFERRMVTDASDFFGKCEDRELPLCVVADAIESSGDSMLAARVRNACATCAQSSVQSTTSTSVPDQQPPLPKAHPPRCWVPRPELDALVRAAESCGLGDGRTKPFLAILCSGDGVPGGTGKVNSAFYFYIA